MQNSEKFIEIIKNTLERLYDENELYITRAIQEEAYPYNIFCDCFYRISLIVADRYTKLGIKLTPEILEKFFKGDNSPNDDELDVIQSIISPFIKFNPSDYEKSIYSFVYNSYPLIVEYDDITNNKSVNERLKKFRKSISKLGNQKKLELYNKLKNWVISEYKSYKPLKTRKSKELFIRCYMDRIDAFAKEIGYDFWKYISNKERSLKKMLKNVK